jgi:hypothetical protein
MEKTGVSIDNSNGRVVRVLVLGVEGTAFCHYRYVSNAYRSGSFETLSFVTNAIEDAKKISEIAKNVTCEHGQKYELSIA